MMTNWTFMWFGTFLVVQTSILALNLPPYFIKDMNQYTLEENTPVGSPVYTLEGADPEESPIRFGIEGTDKFLVDAVTGVVTVAQPIDRESQSGISDNEIRFSVVIQDKVDEGMDNVVKVPISVIILDLNDNPPQFSGIPYKATVNEDTPVGTTIYRAIEAQDIDLVGEILDVICLPSNFGSDLCDYFAIVPRTQDTDIDMFRGSIVLKKPFNYRERQIYQIQLGVLDGKYNDTTDIIFTVLDVQNTPPVFEGSLTGIVNENDTVGTVIMNITAKDGDTGNPRRIIYELVDNPLSYFDIDTNSGELRIAKPLDRESLEASSGVLTLKVRASELINGQPGQDSTTNSMADITVTIRDVNDEPPTFNKQEYKVTIPENVPYGTPLANLNMEIKDTDTGINSIFTIQLQDPSEKFSIDPVRATGHTAVSLKINKKLDFENPNERKFLLLVVATEEKTNRKLSSSATVTVEVEDLNDNHPVFRKESYTASISEQAIPGTPVITITAKDRDSGDYGTSGIVYKLTGSGADKFGVDPKSGVISVSPCPTPGTQNCLDYEQTRAYFLSFSATDNNGQGKKSVVNLRIILSDDNDNPPSFESSEYRANIDEGEANFQPSLILKANDLDDSSRLGYKIINGNIKDLFRIDENTGEIMVRSDQGLRLDNIPTNKIMLNVEVSDGVQSDFASVEIAVKDVNDRSPTFEKTEYIAMIPEDSETGVVIEQVKATDADYGMNAELTYRIQRGAYDDFAIDPNTGEVTLSGKLNFDTRKHYELEIVAVDGGEPSLTGTTTLKIEVMNRNNKLPYFRPHTQRAEVPEDTPAGSRVFQMKAFDEDKERLDSLEYSVMLPISAINKDGQQIEDQERFMKLFSVDPKSGAVTLNEILDRNSVAVISLSVKVTDTSANPPQDGIGNLVITIIDVNDFAPEFPAPWSLEANYITINVKEEKPVGTEVYKFTATDKDSNIARYEIRPRNRYFDIDKGSGKLIVKELFDYEDFEEQKRITFDLKVYDNGIPEKSAEAVVIVNIVNVNDQSPVFEEQMYTATVLENSELGTPIVKVTATDLDDGNFGQVTYNLEGTYKDDFQISHEDGTISVVNKELLDREQLDNLILQVVAVDSAPSESRKSSTVPVNITITDANDNPPRFLQKDYSATIVDNIPFYPEASPIAQVTATDLDMGINSVLFYKIAAGNNEELFRIDNSSGILYPRRSFLGQKGKEFNLVIEVNDESGEGPWSTLDQCRIRINVESVNTHKPAWNPLPPQNETVSVKEESDMIGAVFMSVQAMDQDGPDNDNGKISYFFKVNNENIAETREFKIDQTEGELRTKVKLDREEKDHYELVIVARDHGTPVAFETLRFLNVIVEDIDDNTPKFPTALTSENNIIKFTVPEEEKPGYVVGRVEAVDPDAGKYGRVFYYITKGNEGSWFSIDKTQGTIYTKQTLDREERDRYTLFVKASNNPGFVCEANHCDITMSENDDEDGSILKIEVNIQDINDNDLQFATNQFFVGIPFDANVGDLILDAHAHDVDVEANGKITYSIKSSNLFKQGATESAGSLVPSPFKMTQNGRIILDSLMAEFNQQRFEIDIEAKESRSNHRAKAKVNLWVFEPAQQIKLVINKDPMLVNKEKLNIIMELKNVTEKIVVIDEIRYHVNPASGLRRDMTDMYIHVVDQSTNEIIPPEEVVKVVDANYDYLANYYDEVGIHQVIPAEIKSEEIAFDANLAALIALVLVLFIGFITFFVVMCCLKYWFLSSSNRPMKLQESPRPMKPGSMVDDTLAGGTDNPLWIDQKYKAYEEQELTMTVFSDQDNSVISGNGGSGNSQSRRGSVSQSHLETQSNAYATINKLPMAPSSRRSLFNGSLDIMDHERDYATLDKSARSPIGPVVPGVTSTPISSTLPRRPPSGQGYSHPPQDKSGSNFFLNQDGEPQLVGNLS